MLQQEKSEDFVIPTGRQFSVRDFVNAAAAELGLAISWKGIGVQETGTVAGVNMNRFREALDGRVGSDCHARVGKVIARVDPRHFRPTAVETLLGDPAKAKSRLGWEPKNSFETMVAEMVRENVALSMGKFHGVAQDGFPGGRIHAISSH